MGIAWVIAQSGQYRGGSGDVGRRALHIAAGTLGNMIGGSVLVGLVYWMIFLRTPTTTH